MNIGTIIGISGAVTALVIAVVEVVRNEKLERENAELRYRLRCKEEQPRAERETIIVYGEQPKEEDEKP